MGNAIANDYITISENEMALRCNGSLIIFDTEDYPKISIHQWSIGSHGYATSGSGKTQILMHRMVMNAADFEQIDHINRVKIDNRKRNLRCCSAKQNASNRLALCNSVTGHKGVCKLANGCYQVQLVSNGKTIYLGLYANLDEAVHVSESAQYVISGEYAALTLPVDCLDRDILDRLNAINHHRRMTLEARSKALEMYQAGITRKQIAAELGYSISAIGRLLTSKTYQHSRRRKENA